MKKIIHFLFIQLIFWGSSSAQEVNPGLSPRDSMVSTINLLVRPDVKDNNKIRLEWTGGGVEKNGFYVIERSNDEKNFDVIGEIKAPGKKQYFEFIDEKPSNSKNYYRVKMEIAEGKNIYSRTLTAGLPAGTSCKFYPNPVDKMLIVRTEYTVELQISDAVGKTRINQQLQPGLQLVNVSMLEKGIYFIILKEKDSNKMVSDKLIKN